MAKALMGRAPDALPEGAPTAGRPAPEAAETVPAHPKDKNPDQTQNTQADSLQVMNHTLSKQQRRHKCDLLFLIASFWSGLTFWGRLVL